MKIITSQPDSFSGYFKSIVSFRHLIVTIGIRDLKIIYAQSILGLAWSLLQTLAGLIIISFVFGYLLKIQSGGLPYPIFAFSGMLAWSCFNNILGASGNSLIQNKELIKKMYFPKMIFPLSKVFTILIEIGIWLVLLIGLMCFYGIVPSWRIVFFPAFILLNIITGLSIGLWLSALTYRKRDLGFIIPYLTGFLVLVTPIFYPNSIIPIKYEMIKFCNPLTGIVVGYRWSLLSVDELSWKYCLGFIPILLLLISALFYYRRIEGKLADIL